MTADFGAYFGKVACELQVLHNVKRFTDIKKGLIRNMFFSPDDFKK